MRSLGSAARRAFQWIGTLLVVGADRATISHVVSRLSPAFAAILLTKAIKVAMWRPALASGVGLGDNVPHFPARLSNLVLHSQLLRIAAVVAVLFLVRRLWFRRFSAWWVPSFALAAYVATRVVAALRDGDFDLLGSWTVQQALPEFMLAYSLVRLDILTCIGLLWVGLLVSTFRQRVSPTASRPSLLWLVVTTLLLLGLDLAHFAKTGLMGTGDMLAFLTKNAAGTWFVIRSEADVTTTLLLFGPLALLVLLPILTRLSSLPASTPDPAWRIGLLLAACTGTLLASPATQLSPIYARFANNPLAQLARDTLVSPLSGISRSEADRLAEQAPLLFDSRLATAPSSEPPRRNVVIVLLESIRASATQLYDASLRNTPFLTSLAERGAIVETMYAVEPRTSAAWIAVLHGILPGDGDMFFHWGNLEQDKPTAVGLPRLLEAHGYTTAFFVPTHLNLQNDRQLIQNLSFQHVVHDSAPATSSEGGASPSPFSGRGFERVNVFGFEDRALLEPISTWLDRQVAAQRPFLLTVMTNVGHYPYTLPSTWKASPFDANASTDYQNYLNSVAYLDGFLQELFALFSSRGIENDTIFVILGDHGESFGEHGAKQHFGQAYEEVLRIPALLVAPGLIDPGTRIGGLRQQIDILPTLLELLGLQLTKGLLPGRSLLGDPDPSRRLYFSGVYEDSTLGLRVGSRKYLYNFERTPLEVYDLDADPHESSDIGALLTPEERRAIEMELLVWRSSVNRALLTGHSRE